MTAEAGNSAAAPLWLLLVLQAGISAAGLVVEIVAGRMVADVQAWLDDPSTNFGWIVVGDETQNETAKRFLTVESTSNGGADRPSLTITFSTTGVTGACCDGGACTIVEGSPSCSGIYQGDGTTCSPDPCVPAVTGACCATDGTCTEVTQSECGGVTGSVYRGDDSQCADVFCPVQLTPYVDPLPIPPVATPVSGSPGATAEYTLTMVETEQQLHSELPAPTRVWAYDDGTTTAHTPGPVIEARTGHPVTVNWVNDIVDLDSGVPRTSDHYLEVDVLQDGFGDVCIHGAEDAAKTVTHLHGGHVPAEVDGYPEHTFLPGDPPAVYLYPNDQQAGYLWFHDHALGITRLNVSTNEGMRGLDTAPDGTVLVGGFALISSTHVCFCSSAQYRI